MGSIGSIASTSPMPLGAIPFRKTRSYDRIMRILGSTWFLLLAITVARGLYNDYSILPWPQLLSRNVACCFYLVLWFLVLTRPQANSVASGLLPRVMAFVGSYMPWSITFLGHHSENTLLNILSTICEVGGTCLAIVVVSNLGHAFSVVPQARSVMRKGPYRWIRHPLYLTEEIAFFGLVLQVFSPLSFIVFFTHIGVQVCRIYYEEKLLRRALPEYAAYEQASPWRLIPYVW